MSTPKSVTKIKKNADGSYIEFTDGLDPCEYYIYELSRAALRDVGKFVTRLFREAYYSHFQRITGDAGRATKYKVISGEHTTSPRVQIGLKTGQVDGFYAYFQEFGTTKQKKLGLLTKTVNDNIPEIVKIESQYLSGLESEAAALESQIDEGEYEGDADE